MVASLSLSEPILFVALRSVMADFGFTTDDPSGVIPIIRGQVNRVPTPSNPDFIVMWPLMRNRLATNIDTDLDTHFTGSITNNVLTASLVINPHIVEGMSLYSPTLGPCRILKQLTGIDGGSGTYSVSSIADTASQIMFAGTHQMLQMIEATVQCDVHGPSSADNATRLSTAFWDQASISAFNALGVDIAPLYVDDPRQMPFPNAEDQWEDRWVVDLHLQINPVVMFTQQFAEQLAAQLMIPADLGDIYQL